MATRAGALSMDARLYVLCRIRQLRAGCAARPTLELNWILAGLATGMGLRIVVDVDVDVDGAVRYNRPAYTGTGDTYQVNTVGCIVDRRAQCDTLNRAS